MAQNIKATYNKQITEVNKMSKEALIIAILVALMILWITETLGMRKTSKILSGAIDLGFAALR